MRLCRPHRELDFGCFHAPGDLGDATTRHPHGETMTFPNPRLLAAGCLCLFVSIPDHRSAAGQVNQDPAYTALMIDMYQIVQSIRIRPRATE